LASTDHVFPVDLTAARGHFPGNPVIPGALLLSETLSAIERALQAGLSPSYILFAKFFHPTRPGERVVIDYYSPLAGVVAFNCRVGHRTVLKGEARCGAISAVG
jgi:3-hydroxymyristoyl/3-hydroxydecanoyl-(acyl carrier protein) dehydratase